MQDMNVPKTISVLEAKQREIFASAKAETAPGILATKIATLILEAEEITDEAVRHRFVATTILILFNHAYQAAMTRGH